MKFESGQGNMREIEYNISNFMIISISKSNDTAQDATSDMTLRYIRGVTAALEPKYLQFRGLSPLLSLFLCFSLSGSQCQNDHWLSFQNMKL